MIDVSKIEAGDEVAVRMRVKRVGVDGHDREIVCEHQGNIVYFFSRDDTERIVAHYHKPREFKSGDRVLPRRHRFPCRIVAIDNGYAWLRHAAGNHSAEMLSDLRHADESE